MRESWNNLWIEADTWWKKILYGLLFIAMLAAGFIVSWASGFLT